MSRMTDVVVITSDDGWSGTIVMKEPKENDSVMVFYDDEVRFSYSFRNFFFG